MLSKFDEFIIDIQEKNPDFIFITETWLTATIPDSLVNISNYTVYRKDRTSIREDGRTQKGGGVGIYVKNTIKGHQVVCVRQENLTAHVTETDSLWIKVRINAVQLLLGCIYRPPSCSVGGNREIMEMLTRLNDMPLSTLVFGDFNYPEIDWTLDRVSKNSPLAEEFLQTYHESKLHQLINFNTRFREGTSPSLLDLCLVSDERLITDIEALPPIGKSDHMAIRAIVQLSLTPSGKPLSIHKNYWKANYDSINQFIDQWKPDKDLTHFENCQQVLSQIAETHIPLQHPKNSFKKPWITGAHIKLINQKRRLWHRYRRTKEAHDLETYKTLKNETTKTIRDARKTYETRLLDQGPRRFYQYINHSLDSRLCNFVLRDPHGQLVSQPLLVAEIFANQFAKVFINEDTTSMPQLPAADRSRFSIENIVFTPGKVEKILLDLKLTASPGPDDVSPILLKNCSSTLSSVLANVMTESFVSGTVPDEWKSALVIPIYKKGDKHLAENYRPISLTAIPCKCMEKIIATEITEFIMTHNRDHIHNQHGFLRGRSVTSNLLYNINLWTKAAEEHYPVDVIYLDFEKAFDTVPLERLLHKIEHYGIRGPLLHWIRNYLSNRTFQVRISGTLSGARRVMSGVPQGSVLGPLLFILYVSDIDRGMLCRTSMYADDTKIFCDPSIQHGDLVADLARLEEWTGDWLLGLNVGKCMVLHIGYNNPLLDYHIGDRELTKVTEQVDLGVCVSHDLKWEHHINAAVKRANVTIYLIRRCFREMSPELFLRAYKAYVRPILEHAVVVWCPYFKKDIDLLERVQRRATKIPPTLKNLPYEDRLKALKLTTLHERRDRGCLIETYKILHGHYTCDIDFFHRDTGPRLRGHSLKLTTELSRRLSRINFLTNRVVRKWNELPDGIVTAPTLNAFKNRLDTYMGNIG